MAGDEHKYKVSGCIFFISILIHDLTPSYIECMKFPETRH